ncbi:MAG: serine hydrolase domain-containing protein [Verrucomicrobiota bacterium]|jgi:CubicO group peptidase (beta-lactamase class C family)|nr:serine hydrolase domain-containing protein [Verrucomicrobiota bacterium]|tara:strand:- start:17 stop:1144 length:1128 start_codon:yes stop_codon:yes gene_type:complete
MIPCTATLLALGLLFTCPVFSAEENITARWQPLDDLAAKAVASQKIPGGSVRVVENGKVLFDRAYGVADANSTRRWEKNSPVYIASMTKPITSTLVAVMVGEGKIAFDDLISKYIPEYGRLKMRKSGTEVRSPTIAECLSHTAGFPGGTMGRLPDDSPIRNTSQAGVATILAKQGLVAKPGTKYTYTFRGYAAVARVIEVVTGKRFPEVLDEKLLKPLGMNDTTFEPKLELVKRHPRYARHIAGRDDEEISAYLGNRKRESKGFVNAAGALISTPDDLVKFYRLHSLRGKLAGNNLIPAKVLAKLYEKQPGSTGYGLGFKLYGNAAVGHGGASGTIGAVDLENDRIVVILTQAGATAARPLTRRGKQLAREILAK